MSALPRAVQEYSGPSSRRHRETERSRSRQLPAHDNLGVLVSEAVLLDGLIELAHRCAVAGSEFDGDKSGVQVHIDGIDALNAFHRDMNGMGTRRAIHAEDSEVDLLIFGVSGKRRE